MEPKPLLWVRSALTDLRRFPQTARRRAGHALHQLQQGLTPADFKPVRGVGRGVWEIRIQIGGAYRVVYVSRFEEGIYVLHAFQKRSRGTSRADLTIIESRYREVIGSRGGP